MTFKKRKSQIKTIYIHAKPLSTVQQTGVEVYVHQLLLHIIPGKFPNTRFVLLVDSHLGSNLKRTLRDLGYELEIIRFNRLWTVVGLSLYFLFHRPPKHSLLFVPAHSLPFYCPLQVVCTIHGLEFEQLPETYSLLSRLRLILTTKDAVRRSTAIVCPSNATKQQLVSRYHVPTNKIQVIYHGVDIPRTSHTPPPVRFISGNYLKKTSKYIIFTGRIETKKNLITILDGYRKYSEYLKNDAYKLVLVGPKGFGARAIVTHIKSLGLNDKIALTGHLNQVDAHALIRKAHALLLISHAEGFGIPILEAQRMGVPVVTSNISSMKEVTVYNNVPTALLVDPRSYHAIASGLQEIQNNKTHKHLSRCGYENSQRFSWTSTGLQTSQLLYSLLSR